VRSGFLLLVCFFSYNLPLLLFSRGVRARHQGGTQLLRSVAGWREGGIQLPRCERGATPSVGEREKRGEGSDHARIRPNGATDPRWTTRSCGIEYIGSWGDSCWRGFRMCAPPSLSLSLPAPRGFLWFQQQQRKEAPKCPIKARSKAGRQPCFFFFSPYSLVARRSVEYSACALRVPTRASCFVALLFLNAGIGTKLIFVRSASLLESILYLFAACSGVFEFSRRIIGSVCTIRTGHRLPRCVVVVIIFAAGTKKSTMVGLNSSNSNPLEQTVDWGEVTTVSLQLPRIGSRSFLRPERKNNPAENRKGGE
jgi:hypothetical protein